jgi:tripartite-type tricarboxylate transporter receptor subunit TctC
MPSKPCASKKPDREEETMKNHVSKYLSTAGTGGSPAKRLAHLLVSLALATFASVAAAQFPAKPITLVTPFQAGGSGDAIARAIGEAVAGELGQPVIIENKPGAEGQLGAQDVMKAAPDGYRILLGGAGSQVLLPEQRKTPPYDAVTDFTPIAGVCEFSFFLYVHPSVPATNMREFIDYAKANPGKMNYATSNNQGLITFAHVNKVAGIKLERISYKGEPAALLDLMNGQVHAMFGTSAAVAHVKTGKVRPIVTTLPKRSPLLPEVPTMRESGQADVPFGGGWLAIFGPAGMPKDVVERLSKAFIAANNRPDIRAKMEQLGVAPTPMRPEELATYVREQRVVYRQAVRDIGMPVQ